ncbi:MAG: MFS transporter [Bacteroidetes bacterium]|nr:MFS transporter [Bacteroidota bacterium]
MTQTAFAEALETETGHLPEKDNKKTTTAWAMYDWANSVYPLVISSAIFPIYYTAVTTKKNSAGDIIDDNVVFLGSTFKNTVISNYALALSFLVICFLSPLLSGIADSRGNKKNFMRFFCYLGALSCASLYLLTKEPETFPWGIVSIFFASLGFWSSLVFYNSFLPEIASPENMDKTSAKGFSFGYLGSSLMLILCLVFIQGFSESLGIDKGQATRICFILIAIWWMGFAQIFFTKVKEPKPKLKDESIFKGFHEIQKVFKQVRKSKSINRFLFAFLFYSMGVQTVMLVAAYFGAKLLNMPASQLIPVILIIQFIGIAGSYFFSFISRKKGNKFSLGITLIIWVGICIGAWYDAEYKNIDRDKAVAGFYVLAFFVGAVMGGIQSLSRSTYGKLIPENTIDHASFFSFYDITEKFSMVIGLFIFAYVEQHSPEKGMQNSVLALIVFFAIGFILLQRLKDKRLKAA